MVLSAIGGRGTAIENTRLIQVNMSFDKTRRHHAAFDINLFTFGGEARFDGDYFAVLNANVL
jgi:hypothetical protein